MVTVLLADEHRLYGAALEALLRQTGELEVVGNGNCGAELQALAQRTRPCVTIVDSVLPGLEAALPSVMALRPATSLLLLTGHGSAAELSQAMIWGAHGYLRKNNAPSALIACILELAAGHQYFDPDVLADAVTVGGLLTRPSARELATLRLVAAGLSNKEIARNLALSPGTVRNYVSAVITKTHARNRVDAIRIARKYAWI